LHGGRFERRGLRVAVVTALACLLLGLLIGLAWWWLAPTGDVIAQPGFLFAVDDPELAAGQDGVFALLTGAAGAGVGLWVAVRSASWPVHRAVGALVGGAAGAVAAWQLGGLLGPDPVATGPDVTAGTAVPSPLQLHALGLLGVWPAVTATVAFVALLVVALLGRPVRSGRRRGRH
jgi:hypothetical protein